MNHSSTGQFIRGGQTTQHWYRMAVQVLRYALLVMLTAFTVILGIWCYAKFDYTKFVQSRFWVLARINAEYRSRPEIVLRVPLPDGRILNWSSDRIYRSASFRDAYYELESLSVRGMVVAGQSSIGFGLISLLIFAAAGRKLGHDEHIRGAQLVAVNELKGYSSRKWKELHKRDKLVAAQPRYEMGGLQFPPDALQAQTGIFGTTGSGKTTLIKDLIASIRASGGHAIIYDRTGDYAASFYDEDCDFIINPFDSRSHCWSPFFDADTPESFTQLYEVLIPSSGNEKDPFWPKSARIVAEFVSRELVKRGHATNANLRDALMNISMEDLANLVQSTPAEKFVGEDSGKMGSSVYATMLAELRFLEFLRDDGPAFSARRWVKSNLGHYKDTVDQETGEVLPARSAPEQRTGEKGSFVFLTGHPEMDAATRNITSAIMELAANALMGGPEAFSPQVFFIIDELPALNRLPFLTGKLAEVRKVGGCFVVGFQVLSQLEDIYGKEGATTVLGNLNNTFYGSTPDETTADRFSKNLGMVDQVESRENISVGANENRDGVGFIKNRFERRIATSTEIMKLPQFQTYATFAYDSPTALLKFKRNTQPKVAEGLQPYTGTGFGTGSLDPDKFAQRAKFMEAPIHKHAVEFSAWVHTYEDLHRSPESPQLTESDKRALWAYYAEQRIAGIAKDLVGPPCVGKEYLFSVRDAAASNPRSPHAYALDAFPSDAFDQNKLGPRVVVSGSSAWEDEARVWDVLDRVFQKQNDMVLCHKGMIGAEIIASKWAVDRRIPQIVFGPKFDLYAEDAPDKADEEMTRRDTKAVLVFGSDRDAQNLRSIAYHHPLIKIFTYQRKSETLELPDYPLTEQPQMSEPGKNCASVVQVASSSASRCAPDGGATQSKRKKAPRRPKGVETLRLRKRDLLNGDARVRDDLQDIRLRGVVELRPRPTLSTAPNRKSKRRSSRRSEAFWVN